MDHMHLDGRSFTVAAFVMAALAGCEKLANGAHSPTTAHRDGPDPNETYVLPRD